MRPNFTNADVHAAILRVPTLKLVPAQVFVGKYEGTIVAIKLLLNVDEASLERFRQEVALMAALRHPNLLLFMGYARSPALAMVSE